MFLPLLLLKPDGFPDYELIDSGGFEKLERFGKLMVRRPEPQAIWNPSLAPSEWEKLAHATFSLQRDEAEKGSWSLKKGVPEQWAIQVPLPRAHFTLRLGFSGFRHIGVFPEQMPNWTFIYQQLQSQEVPGRILNLFAYTGAASLAAKAAGADVVHVDSVKPVISWARNNMELSGLDGIRWVVEDAMAFVRREVRRNAVYSGIILDPPAYGRGAQGEKWVLAEQLNEMVQLCHQLLDPHKGFLVLNTYSMGFSALVGNNLAESYFGREPHKSCGELYIEDKFGKKLPLGTFVRISHLKSLL